MLADNKITRGFCSTGISLHWGTSNLIVLTIIVAMLGMTQVALAGLHEPEPCWSCCPNGPLCVNNPDSVNYRAVVAHSIAYTNTQVAKNPLAAAEWDALATEMYNWQVEADKNGTMESINLFYKNNAAILEAPTFDMTKLVPALKSLGYQGSWTQLAWAMNKLTQQQRINMVNYVLKYGYSGVVSFTITSARNIAKSLAAHEPVIPCGFIEGGAYWFGFGAAAAAITGNEELVIPLGFIGATFALAGYMGGC
jgi:hypothetical protein